MERLRGEQRSHRIPCEQRRNLERNPTVDPRGTFVHRSKQVCRCREIPQCQIKEKRLAVSACCHALADLLVVGGTALQGVKKMVGLDVSPVTDSSLM